MILQSEHEQAKLWLAFELPVEWAYRFGAPRIWYTWNYDTFQWTPAYDRNIWLRRAGNKDA